jgi:hypothetical protein
LSANPNTLSMNSSPTSLFSLHPFAACGRADSVPVGARQIAGRAGEPSRPARKSENLRHKDCMLRQAAEQEQILALHIVLCVCRRQDLARSTELRTCFGWGVFEKSS